MALQSPRRDDRNLGLLAHGPGFQDQFGRAMSDACTDRFVHPVGDVERGPGTGVLQRLGTADCGDGSEYHHQNCQWETEHYTPGSEQGEPASDLADPAVTPRHQMAQSRRIVSAWTDVNICTTLTWLGPFSSGGHRWSIRRSCRKVVLFGIHWNGAMFRADIAGHGRRPDGDGTAAASVLHEGDGLVG